MSKQKDPTGVSSQSKQHIDALYARDPIAADAALWGRKSSPISRRGFLKTQALRQ